MSVQENAARLRELGRMYPDELKVFRSAEKIEGLLDFDAVMKGGTAGVNSFTNDDPAWPDFISKQLASGKDVSVSPGGKHLILVIVGDGLFKKRNMRQAEAASGSGGKVFSLDMNKGLWKDGAAFNRYFHTVLVFNKTVADRNIVSERSKPASRERMKTSHFEERIALRVVQTAQRCDESTQRELATFDNDLGSAWLVPPADCA